jgi:hypothetical protein
LPSFGCRHDSLSRLARVTPPAHNAAERGTLAKRFIAVVEGGSLGKAADNLSLSQPGLSKSIHQLEAHFGEPLFYRGTKSTRPSPAASPATSLLESPAGPVSSAG